MYLHVHAPPLAVSSCSCRHLFLRLCTAQPLFAVNPLLQAQLCAAAPGLTWAWFTIILSPFLMRQVHRDLHPVPLGLIVTCVCATHKLPQTMQHGAASIALQELVQRSSTTHQTWAGGCGLEKKSRSATIRVFALIAAAETGNKTNLSRRRAPLAIEATPRLATLVVPETLRPTAGSF